MTDDRSYVQALIQAQAKEIADRATVPAMRVLYVDWQVANNAARVAVAEALACILQEAAFYGEDSVSVNRLRRLKEQLNPGDTSVGADT